MKIRPLIALTAAVILLGGCDLPDSEVVDAPVADDDTGDDDAADEQQDEEPADDAEDEPTEAEEEAAGPAAVGNTLELESSSGAVIAVTVTQVIDPATPGEFGEPDGRLVAVELQMVHQGGGETYEDSPGNGSTLVDTDGRTYSITFEDSPDCPSFSSGSVTLSEGDSRTGCVAFDVPEGVTLDVFEYGLDSGFAAQTGRWTIG